MEGDKPSVAYWKDVSFESWCDEPRDGDEDEDDWGDEEAAAYLRMVEDEDGTFRMTMYQGAAQLATSLVAAAATAYTLY